MQKQRIVIFLLLFISISLGFFFLYNIVINLTSNNEYSAVKESPNASIIKVFRKKWTYLIQKNGGEKSYEQFKKENLLISSLEKQHIYMHLFGDVLFSIKGDASLAVCDSTFNYACFHSIFIASIKKSGLNSIQNLEKNCIAKSHTNPTGCVHGIGHGIFEYLGNKEKNISRALELCSTLKTQGQFNGCHSGVFMSFNEPADNLTISFKLRTFDPKMPYKPCTSILKIYQTACYFELSRWLLAVFHKDFTKVGSVCSHIPNATNKQACFISIGYYNAYAHFKKNTLIIKTCQAFGSNVEKLYCSIGANWFYKSSYPQFYKDAMFCDINTTYDSCKILSAENTKNFF